MASFPNLAPTDSKAKYHSTNTGVPANGLNIFALGITPFVKVDPNRLIFTVVPQGPSVTAASFVGYNSVTGEVSMNFTQSGGDACRVDAELEHSIEW